MINFNKKNNLITIFIFLMLLTFYRFYGEKLELNTEYCKNPKLWLHAAGSHEKLKYAFENEYCGVEVDTTFSPYRGLIASYNKPNDINAKNLKDLIAKNKGIKYWWLDFKNLNYSNANESAQLLKNLSVIYKEHVFLIESHDFIGLWFLNLELENFYKVYWLSKGPNKNDNIHWSTPLYYFRSALANIVINPDFISMFYYQVGQRDFLWLGKRQKFAFTVNDINEYKRLIQMGVYVILTDNL
tara:strand:- start:17 stop:742 length:726 start_codon:yes stop_codon:yes gene_type:complete